MTPIDFRTVTHQQMFDHAIRGIISQGGPSVHRLKDGMMTCRYNSILEDGGEAHCAVGWLIKDISFKNRAYIEGFSALQLLEDMRSDRPDDDTILFMARLQKAHDQAAHFEEQGHPSKFWGLFKRNCKEVASAHGLKPNVLREIPQEEPA